MDSIVTQIVLDRRGITDNFDQKLGISVNQLISKLVDQDRLTLALEDAKQARQELEAVSRQKNELELEVGQKDSKSHSICSIQSIISRNDPPMHHATTVSL
jgi:cytokinesis protein